MYKLFDKHGRGAVGAMSIGIWPINMVDASDGIETSHHTRPRKGIAIRVGAQHTTMFGADMWWQTTVITLIIVDTPNRVVFKTLSGSVYTWEII